MIHQGASNRRRYRFGEFLLDPIARELKREGELLTVSPKVLDCIAYLIEHRDRAVGRDELIAAVWGKVDVAYTLLGQLVTKVRRAMGGTGNGQDVIRTIPRFGYRWVAEVEVEDDADMALSRAETSSRTPVDSHAHANRYARKAWLLLALLPVAMLGSWSYFNVRTETPAPAAPPVPVVSDAAAILPVEVAATAELTWVRLGMMDLIGDRLRRAGQPVVPSDNIVALARSNAKDRLRQTIRVVTGARYIVAPTAARQEEEWLVSLRLELEDGSGYTVAANASDITEAGRRASDRLLTRLGRRVPPGSDDASAVSEDELLARAKAALLSNDLNAARQILESAPEKIQRSPEVRRRIAQVEYRSGRLQAASGRLDELMRELVAESDPRLRAATLNDSGIVAIYLDQPAQAESRFAEAISLLAGEDHPFELGRAHLGLAIAFAMQGEFGHSSPEFSKARVAFDVTGDAVALATIEYDEGRLEAAREHFAAARPIIDRAAEHFERLGLRDELLHANAVRINIALALLDPADALAIGTQAQPLLASMQNPRTHREFQLQWGRALTATGRFRDARAVFGGLVHAAVPQEESAMFLASVDAYRAALDLAVGNVEAALVPAARAAEVLSLPDYASERSLAWSVHVRALRVLGRRADAAAEADRFSDWAAQANYSRAVIRATTIAAEQAWQESSRETADNLYEIALQRAIEGGVPADLAEVVESYGGMLLRAHEFDRASAVIGLSGRFAKHDYGSAVMLARLYHALGRRDVWQASLEQARRLAGERSIPAEILAPPSDRPFGGSAF